MGNNNNNNESQSLIRLNNTNLLKVGKSFNICEKLISQGCLIEQNHSKIKIIPYKKDGKWYLYHIKNKQFSNKNFKYFRRNRDYLLCIDDNKYYYLFKQDKFLCKFEGSSNSWCPNFIVSKSGLLVLWFNIATKGRKYYTGSYRQIIGPFNLKGERLDHNISNEYLDEMISYENKNRPTKDIQIQDTLWSVRSNSLYFKDKQVINGDFFSEILVHTFHYGYALVEDFGDVCAEFGEVYKTDLGFIDVYGNYYWDNLNPTYDNRSSI